MALDLSAGSLIRSGSGLLFVLLGLALLSTKRRGDPRVLSLALFAIPFGASFVLSNIFLAASGLVLVPQALCYLASVVAVVAILRTMPPRATPIGALLAGALAIVAYVAIELPGFVAFGQALGLDTTRPSAQLVLAANAAAIGSWLLLPPFLAIAARSASEAERRKLALISSAFVLYLGAAAGSDLVAQGVFLTAFFNPPVAIAALGLTGLAWLAVLARGGGPSARNAALLPFAAILAGMAPYLVSPTAFNDWGLVGIARVLSWSILVYAIVRVDILGLGLAKRSVDRSALAAGALAALFIVAQIGQNFLSAEYGLLTGGIVAGAFLFAAQPIQRAIERATGPARGQAQGDAQAQGPTSEFRPSTSSVDVYRHAVRAAYRDGVITRREERHLAHVAQHLGIGAADAIDIHDEIALEGRRE